MFIYVFILYIRCNIRPTYLCKYFGEIAPFVIKSIKSVIKNFDEIENHQHRTNFIASLFLYFFFFRFDVVTGLLLPASFCKQKRNKVYVYDMYYHRGCGGGGWTLALKALVGGALNISTDGVGWRCRSGY